MFKPRSAGSTLRRPATTKTTIRRSAEVAVHDPHDARERLDPEFQLLLHCDVCGKAGTAPRRLIRDAINEHVTTKHAQHDGPVSVRVLFPKQ